MSLNVAELLGDAEVVVAGAGVVVVSVYVAQWVFWQIRWKLIEREATREQEQWDRDRRYQ